MTLTAEMIKPAREILFIQREVEDDYFGENSVLVRPPSTKKQMGIAKVLAVGPDVKGFEAGDSIYLGVLCGLKLTEIGDGYFLVNVNEVQAKIVASDE